MKTKVDFPSINEREPDGRREDGTSYRVLVVDDSMFVTKQIGQILTSEGFEVVGTAADGEAGVEKYKELFPNVDVVTMDITMPRMDGVTALEKMYRIDSLGKCHRSSQPRADAVKLKMGRSALETLRLKQEAISHYLFYLAFENSLCNYYITEKFFATLKFDTIPIVLGDMSRKYQDFVRIFK
jgi:CheY-like chemotaxis protein